MIVTFLLDLNIKKLNAEKFYKHSCISFTIWN